MTDERERIRATHRGCGRDGRARWRRWFPTALALAATVVFVAFIAFLDYRDSQSTDRCEALGGQTWDSGEHCAIGVDRVIDTHSGTWG